MKKVTRLIATRGWGNLKEFTNRRKAEMAKWWGPTSGCAHAAWWHLGTATGTDSLWRPRNGGMWFQSSKRTSWRWEAVELCLCMGEDEKNRLGSLNTEGLCWSRVQAEDACRLSPRRMQWLQSSSPGHAASAGVIPSACALRCAVQENSTETEKKLPHALCFQLI